VPPSPPPLRRSPARALYAIGAAALLAGLALVFVFNPTQTHLFPPCPLYAATGLYCPGCGSTRAVHHLLHGHVAAALGYNPLMVVSLPLLAYAAARGFFRALPPRRPLPAWAVWVAFAVLVGFGIARNLPWAAVRWMAPHDARATTDAPPQPARSTVASPPPGVSRPRWSPSPLRPV
jgi:hypothetical protein